MSMKKLVMATNNADKLYEVRQMLNGKYDVCSLADIGCHENDSRQPPLATLINLASTFGVTTDYLLGVEKKRPLNLSGLTESDIETLRYIIEKMVAANTTER